MATSDTKASEPKLPIYYFASPGYYLDGWADLIEDMGKKADTVRANVLKQLQARDMPDIDVGEYHAVIRLSRRPYVISRTEPGAATSIYIQKHGKDLYAAWRTFIKPTLNMILVIIMVGISGMLVFFSMFTAAFFDANVTLFGLASTLFGTFISSLLFQIILVAIAGRIIKGDWLAFLLVEPNWFDAEDITAMSLSAHKTVLRALDKAGIDISKLRLKQTFKGGRKEADI